MKTTLSCPAKVNLFLAILERDESGFHKIDTVFARVNQLQDFIHIEPAETSIGLNLQVQCGENLQPEEIVEMQNLQPEDNSVLRAITLLEHEARRKFSYKIVLEKNIPPQSGLGGGASNAAAILTYLNEVEGLRLPHERLMELAAKIGMDVPFFVSGCQVAHGTHYGEEIEPLPDLPYELQMEIHLTGEKTSTKQAFAEWDASYAAARKSHRFTASQNSSDPIIRAIKKGDAKAILGNLHNDFSCREHALEASTTFHSLQHSSVILLAGSGGAHVSFYVADTSQ